MPCFTILTTYLSFDERFQIVEIRKTARPDEFKIWAFTKADILKCMTIRIPRIIYVNCHQALPENLLLAFQGRRVVRILPRHKPCRHLYELNLPESLFVSSGCNDFHDDAQSSSALNTLLTHPDVEGVYETQMPLIFRALYRLGCVATLTTRALQHYGQNAERLKRDDILDMDVSMASFLLLNNLSPVMYSVSPKYMFLLFCFY